MFYFLVGWFLRPFLALTLSRHFKTFNSQGFLPFFQCCHGCSNKTLLFCWHNKQPVQNKRTPSVWGGCNDPRGFQHTCRRSSSFGSRCLQTFLGFVKSVVPLKDAHRFWSGRQSECRRTYKHNMDARWAEEDNQTCVQELWLLSAAVGQDSGLKVFNLTQIWMLLTLSDTEQMLLSRF